MPLIVQKRQKLSTTCLFPNSRLRGSGLLDPAGTSCLERKGEGSLDQVFMYSQWVKPGARRGERGGVAHCRRRAHYQRQHLFTLAWISNILLPCESKGGGGITWGAKHCGGNLNKHGSSRDSPREFDPPNLGGKWIPSGSGSEVEERARVCSREIYGADCVRSSSIIQTPQLRKQWKLATWMAGKQVNQGSKASSDKSASTVCQSELASHVKLTIKTFNNSNLLIYDTKKEIIHYKIWNFLIFFFPNKSN